MIFTMKNSDFQNSSFHISQDFDDSEEKRLGKYVGNWYAKFTERQLDIFLGS